jgi:gamma-glutamyltranspeptidase/glutathione hydrolase
MKIPAFLTETWQLNKSAAHGEHGMVASQHYLASEVGAQVLREGGNAIDAAIAAGFALGTVEPWMSGIGGGGYMTVRLASGETRVVEFGMRAPFASTADDYPLAGEGENASDAFNWPKVVDDANVEGPRSIAVPGYVKGMALALETFGTRSWSQLLDPAYQLASQGLPLDWFTAHKITTFSRNLKRDDECRRVYLADGLPPSAHIEGELTTIPLGKLADTLQILRDRGPSAYYEGELAERIVTDLQAVGSRIDMNDLSAYEARIGDPLALDYRGAKVNVAGHLTAGPSLTQALSRLDGLLDVRTAKPDVDAYRAYATSLLDTYAYRLTNLGEGSPTAPGATSHLCTADSFGNVVSLTQTIMSGFGSRVMLPQSGVLMNNGMMWFDPRPGGPNSVVGGRHPLSNMCPAIVSTADGSHIAIGACGGRKIFPAVFQLVSFLTDYGMSVDDAVSVARLDNSGTSTVTLMDHIDPAIATALAAQLPDVRTRPNAVAPNFFALPQVVRANANGSFEGGCFIASPHAKAVAA